MPAINQSESTSSLWTALGGAALATAAFCTGPSLWFNRAVMALGSGYAGHSLYNSGYTLLTNVSKGFGKLLEKQANAQKDVAKIDDAIQKITNQMNGERSKIEYPALTAIRSAIPSSFLGAMACGFGALTYGASFGIGAAMGGALGLVAGGMNYCVNMASIEEKKSVAKSNANDDQKKIQDFIGKLMQKRSSVTIDGHTYNQGNCFSVFHSLINHGPIKTKIKIAVRLRDNGQMNQIYLTLMDKVFEGANFIDSEFTELGGRQKALLVAIGTYLQSPLAS